MTLLLNNYGGYIDPFYEKFTTPKQFSMILGGSRALQGISPKVLDSCLKKSNYKLPTYNFSFTIAQAVYGPSFLSALKRKLDTNATNQLFIVTVNPWVLSNRTPKSKVESDSIYKNTPPHNMNFMSLEPNVEYLVKNFRYFNFESIFKKNYFLHKNGLSEAINFQNDKHVYLERKKNQIDAFKNWSLDWDISKYRLNWLNKTIKYLQKYGKVIVVRMPIDKEFLEIENKFWNHFDIDMETITKNAEIDYFNFSKNWWSTYDGHHLDKNGGKMFTTKLSELIKLSE